MRVIALARWRVGALTQCTGTGWDVLERANPQTRKPANCYWRAQKMPRRLVGASDVRIGFLPSPFPASQDGPLKVIVLLLLYEKNRLPVNPQSTFYLEVAQLKLCKPW